MCPQMFVFRLELISSCAEVFFGEKPLPHHPVLPRGRSGIQPLPSKPWEQPSPSLGLSCPGAGAGVCLSLLEQSRRRHSLPGGIGAAPASHMPGWRDGGVGGHLSGTGRWLGWAQAGPHCPPWPLAAGGSWRLGAEGQGQRERRSREAPWGPGLLPALLAGVWHGRDGWRSPVKPWTRGLPQEG